jgi:hypothetical protein
MKILLTSVEGNDMKHFLLLLAGYLSWVIAICLFMVDAAGFPYVFLNDHPANGFPASAGTHYVWVIMAVFFVLFWVSAQRLLHKAGERLP